MKNLQIYSVLLLISIAFLLPVSTKAQEYYTTHDGWKWLSPLPFGGRFKTTCMIDENHIVVGGYNGRAVIYYTENGGVNWQEANIPDDIDNTVKAICSSDGSTFAISDGRLLVSNDNGANWEYWNESFYEWQLILENVHEFQFMTENLGYACTNNGIYKTFDGGDSWAELTTILSFTDMSFISNDLGWGLHEYGNSVYKTTDGGYNFFQQDLGINDQDLFNIQFLNEDIGFVSCETGVLKTTDGGQNWNMSLEAEIPSAYFNRDYLYFTQEGHGFLTTVGFLSFRSIDYGESWDTLNNKIIPGSIHFLDDDIGWISNTGAPGSRGPYKTIDGGITWDSLPFNWGSFLGLSALSEDSLWMFSHSLNGHVCNFFSFSTNGGIIRNNCKYSNNSNNNKSQFFSMKNGYHLLKNIFPITYGNLNRLTLSENYQFIYADIQRSRAGGQGVQILVKDSLTNKNYILTPFLGDFLVTDFLEDFEELQNYNDLWSSYDLILLQKEDTLTVLSEDTDPANIFVNATWAGGTSYGGDPGVWYTYQNMFIGLYNPLIIGNSPIKGIPPVKVNSGLTFQNSFFISDSIWRWNGGTSNEDLESLGKPGSYLNDLNIYLDNDNSISLVADNCEIYHSVNGGDFWFDTYKPTPLVAGITNVYFTSDNIGYVTNSSDLYQTTNGGFDWEFVATHGLGDVDRLYAFDDNTYSFVKGFAGGLIRIDNTSGTASGVGATSVEDFCFINLNEGWYINQNEVYHTSDGGQTWDQQSWFIAELNTISFIDNQTGYIGGNFGKIIRTVDGGLTWEDVSVAGVHVNCIDFVTTDIGYVGGDGGTFYHTIDGGIYWETKHIPVNDDIHNMRFFDENKGYFVVADGYYRTTDGGETFTLYITPVRDNEFFKDKEYFPLEHHRKTPSLFVMNQSFQDFIYAYDINILRNSGATPPFGIEEQNINNSLNLSVHPNPAQDYFVLDFDLPENCDVTINLLNIKGQIIRILRNVTLLKGNNTINCNTKDIKAGTYFVSLESSAISAAAKKVIIIR